MGSAQDDGATNTADVVSFALVLKLRNTDQLAQFISDVTDPSSASYHQFLTPAQFVAKYSPTQTAVNAAVRNLNMAGIAVTGVSDNQTIIYAQGSVSAINGYFATEIHNFANGTQGFRAPVKTPTVPAALGSSVAAVVGLSTQAIYRSMAVQSLNPAIAQAPTAVASPGIALSPFGQLTVNDVSTLYQMGPLYSKGYTGAGRTIGIATLATFNPSDAYAYWKGVGLKVSQTRITRVHVDGGALTAGAIETTLDVEAVGRFGPRCKHQGLRRTQHRPGFPGRVRKSGGGEQGGHAVG